MGRKISVDSATMMNKGLEMIEAHWLFGVPRERIEIVIHPESVIHSLVEYVDGSVLAQLGHPDMRTPIAQALAFPERIDTGVPALELVRRGALTFEARTASASEHRPRVSRARCRGTAPGSPQCGERGRGRSLPRRADSLHRHCPGLRRGARARGLALRRHARRRARRRCRISRGDLRLAEARLARVMDPITRIVAFLVVLGILVVFHELGHFVVARWCGVKVLRFSVGFGRVIWSRRWGADAIEWAISAIPLGGLRQDARRARRAGRCRRSASGVQSPERVQEDCDRRRGSDREPAARGSAVRRHVRVRHPGTAGAAHRPARVDAGGCRRDPRRAISSWRSTGSRCAAGRTCDGGCCAHQGESAATIDVERPDGARISRKLSLASVSGTDWEGNFMSMLGLRADLGVPLIEEVVADKPAAKAGLAKGDRIVAIDGVPVRSPRRSRRRRMRSPARRSHFASSATASSVTWR
jgi:hypothetical protein